MRISACPRCGSKNISAGTMRSGILYGISSWMEECRDCGFKGSPVVFDSESEYLDFLKNVKMKFVKKKKTESSNKDNNIQPNNELVDDDKTKDYKQVISHHWHASNWWIEIGLAIIIAVFVSLFRVKGNITIMGMGVGFIYTILEIIIYFIILLIVIVFVEYLFQLIRKSLKNL